MPGARFERRAADGGGPRTLRFTVAVGRRPRPGGRVRLRRAARRSTARGAGRRDLPAGAQRLERRRRAAAACCATRGRARPPRSRCSASPSDYLAAVLAELELELAPAPAATAGEPDASPQPPSRRAATAALDRRGESPLAVLADALCRRRTGAGGVRRRAAAADRAGDRAGGFALISYHALERRPGAGGAVRARGRARSAGVSGRGRPALHARRAASPTWRGARLSYALLSRCTSWSTVSVLRSSPSTGPSGPERAAGEELERLLRGDGPHGRSARLAGRLSGSSRSWSSSASTGICRPWRSPGTAPTALERSPAYRVYAQRYEDGRRFLSSANHRPSG